MCLILLAGINALVFHTTIYQRVDKWDLAAVTPTAAKLAGAFFAGALGGRNFWTMDRLLVMRAKSAAHILLMIVRLFAFILLSTGLAASVLTAGPATAQDFSVVTQPPKATQQGEQTFETRAPLATVWMAAARWAPISIRFVWALM